MPTNKFYVGDKVVAESYAVYDEMDNLPKINGKQLNGDLTNDDISVYGKDDVDDLIETSKEIRVYPSESSFTPEPNIQYYIGPDEYGEYKVVIYTTSGGKVELGSTKGRVATLQTKLPVSGGKYDIGHNNGATDGRTLTKHTVADSINELDSLLPNKIGTVADNLTTSSKSIVGSINELKTRLDKYQQPFEKKGFQSVVEVGQLANWETIVSFRGVESYWVSDVDDSMSITFWVLPNFAGSQMGLGGGPGGIGTIYVQPALFHYHGIFNWKTGAHQDFLYALVQSRESVMAYYGLQFCLRHNGTTHDLMIGGYNPKGKNFKIEVIDKDTTRRHDCFVLPGTSAAGNPTGAVITPLSDLGYPYIYWS